MNDLLCPICKSKLVEGDGRIYTTWADDICDPNHEEANFFRPTNVCVNEECPARDMGFFDYAGDWYGFKTYTADLHKRLASLAPGNEMTALYGSSRTIHHEERKHLQLLNAYFFKVYLEWRTKVEPKYGDKIGIKELKLSMSIKDGTGYTQYTSGIHMLLFCISSFYKNKKNYLENNSKYSREELKKDFVKRDWDNRWWHVASLWYFKTFEYGIFNLINAKELLEGK